MATDMIAIHMPSADHVDLARLFGHESGDRIDKFAGCRWHPGPAGVPILDDCRGWVAGPVRDRVNLGDHVGLIIDIDHAHDAGIGRQLRASDIRDLRPGHPA
jgi:flavin reductase (DIM6/NTAB) family NADH-FMN oxidoreductase RutF